MRRYTIQSGTTFDRNGHTLNLTREEIRHRVETAALALSITGYTLTFTIGSWQDPATGRYFHEDGVQVEVIEVDLFSERARRFAAVIRNSFEQATTLFYSQAVQHSELV
jgi:hypothetical protein